MNHQEWLNWRREGIGGSDAAVILGVSPWRTLYDLYEEKALGIDKEVETPAMRRGKEKEEEARRCLENLLGVQFFPTNIVHPTKPWLRGSLDGLTMDRKIACEIKCPGTNSESHKVAMDHEIVPYHYSQIQHYYNLDNEIERFYYFSYIDDKNHVITEVKRDKEYIGRYEILAGDFWQMVEMKIPPEKINKYIPMQEEDQWDKLEQEWLVLKSRHDADEKALKRIREECATLSGGKGAEGDFMRLIVSECKGSVDYVLAIEDYLAYLNQEYPDIEFPPLDLEKYRKEGFTKYSLKAI